MLNFGAEIQPVQSGGDRRKKKKKKKKKGRGSAKKKVISAPYLRERILSKAGIEDGIRDLVTI